MRRRPLGCTGIEASEIGLGTAQLANADGSSPGGPRGAPPDPPFFPH